MKAGNRMKVEPSVSSEAVPSRAYEDCDAPTSDVFSYDPQPPNRCSQRLHTTDKHVQIESYQPSLGMRLSSLAKVAPAALIQFVDFATDVLVIAALYREGLPTWPWVAAGFLATSMVTTLCFFLDLLTRFFSQRRSCKRHGTPMARWTSYVSLWEIPLMIALAPFNLHLLYMSAIIGRAEANDDPETTGYLFFLYSFLKLIETVLESIPMLCITLLVLFDDVEDSSAITGEARSLLCASMALSLLSVTYGVFTCAPRLPRQAPASRLTPPRPPPRMKTHRTRRIRTWCATSTARCTLLPFL